MRARRRAPVQVPELGEETSSTFRKIILEAGYRGVLVVPLLRPDKIVGALVVRRREPGEFDDTGCPPGWKPLPPNRSLAIQNAKLFRRDRG